MSADPNALIRELAERSRDRGWGQAARCCELLLAGPAGLVPLLCADGADPGPLVAWLSEKGLSTRIETLGAAGADPVPALAAARIVAAVPCGRMPEIEEIDALGLALKAREPRDFAVVLTHAERVDSGEALDLVERMARRLLVPAADAEAGDAREMSALGIYFWSDEPGELFLGDRLAADRDALVAWATRPPSPGAERGLIASALAEEATRAAEGSVAPDESGDASEALIAAQGGLLELRTRVLSRLTSESSALEKSLTTGLQSLQQDLSDRFERHLARSHPPGSGPIRWPAAVQEYVAVEVAAWHDRTEVAIRKGIERVGHAVSEPIDRFDWSAINLAATRLGQPADFPARFGRVFESKASFSPASDPGSRPNADPVGRGGARDTFGRTAIKVAIGAGLAPLMAGLAGMGVIGMAVAGAAGATAGAAASEVERNLRQSSSRQAYVDAGRRYIDQSIRRQVQQIRDYLGLVSGEVRKKLQDAFTDVDGLIGQALAAPRTATTASPTQEDLAWLADWNQRMLALIGR